MIPATAILAPGMKFVDPHMNDTLTGGFADLLRTLSGATGLLIEGELPVDYGAAGVRLNVDAQDVVTVFFQFDAGAARVGSDCGSRTRAGKT